MTTIDRLDERHALDLRTAELLTADPDIVQGPATRYRPFSCVAWMPGDDWLGWSDWMRQHAPEALARYQTFAVVPPLPVGTPVRFVADVRVPCGVIAAGTEGRVSKRGVFVPLRADCEFGDVYGALDVAGVLVSVFEVVGEMEMVR